jgi:carbonic anhydrase
MTSISKLSFLMKKGRIDEAVASLASYRTVVSDSVSVSGDKVKVMGLVMHVSKGKKLAMMKSTQQDKRSRIEIIYYRLVFCR